MFSDCNNRDQMGTCGQNSKPGSEHSSACLSSFLMSLLFTRFSFMAFLFIIREKAGRTAVERKKSATKQQRSKA